MSIEVALDDFAPASEAEPGLRFARLRSRDVNFKADVEPRFSESWPARARRLALGTAYALRPHRLSLAPVATLMAAEFMVSKARAARRLENPEFLGEQGLIGVSEDLTPQALFEGYRSGMYPFCHIGPMKWWSAAERAVLRPGEIRIEKNLRRAIRQGKYRVTFDTDFAGVVRACAEPRPGKTPLTWITPKMMRAFWGLHEAGHAHSVEVRDPEGNLVGGLYGVACGGVFFGESQFSLVRDASKIANATLACHLAHWGFALRDAKNMTEHLASLGFRSMPRAEFLSELQEHAWKPGKVGAWTLDDDLDVGAWQPRT
jgi:leucyl/phenylalanyl-tRNA--protein transferase